MKSCLATLVLAQIVSCALMFERPTQVKLEGGERPVFVLSGSGTLGDLVVYGPKQRDMFGDRSNAIWEIVAKKGQLNGRGVEDLARISYGIVPEGYKQVYPERSAPPPSLVPGVKYQYWFITVNAPHARKDFEIRDGKAVEIPD